MPTIGHDGVEAGYGDVDALAELAARHPHAAPVGVFQVFNQAPFTIAVRADGPMAVFMAHQNAPTCLTVARDGPVQGPADLAGRIVSGHASDVALRTFAAYARSAGLDPTAIRIKTADARMADLLRDMLAGKTDAVFGYLTTHTAALAGIGLCAEATVRFLSYRAQCSALYGSALMVAPRLLRESPAAVAALVQATRAGITAAQTEPEAAIDAVLAHNPAANRQIEHQRWLGTLLGDIGARPAATRPWEGLGGVDEARLGAAIDCLAAASGWGHRPAADRVFTHRFLSHPA